MVTALQRELPRSRSLHTLLLHNNEINVIVIGKDFADKMEELFEQDLTASTEVTQEEWSHRPLLERIREVFSRLLAFWL